MENKRTLSLRIDRLKNEIQYLINKMNTYDKKEFIEELKVMENEKIEKSKDLDSYIIKLKDLVKEENKEKYITSNINKLYKGKNLNETIKKTNKAKELREQAKKEYIEFSKYELEYNKYDSQHLPGYIFLYKQILDTYGLCPYIKIEPPTFDLFSQQNKFYIFDGNTLDTVELESDKLDTYIESSDKLNEFESTNCIKKVVEIYNTFIENDKNPIVYEYTNKNLIEFASFIIDNSVKKKKLLEPDNVKNVIKSTNLILKKIVENNRKNWLESRSDKGELYYQIRDNIVYKHDYNNELSLQNTSEYNLKNYINLVFTDSQKNLLKDSISFIENEYTTCLVKSKKIKERFKILIKALTFLFTETKLCIHEYLTIKYNTEFFVNVENIKPDLEFSRLLDIYKELKQTTEQKRIYAYNMNRNLYDELCLFLTNKKDFEMNNTEIVQAGKYFRRWIALSKDEKNERFESFSDYYIEKYMIRENLLKPIDKANLVEKLSKLLIYAYSKKHMIYRDFKWTTKKGLIENVKVIKYNKATEEFELNKVLTNLDEDGNIKDKKCKKRSSVKSIFSTHERIVNEEILVFIVKYIQDNQPKLIKKLEDSTIDDCVNIVKSKMKLNKIGKDDKLLITHKLREMYSIIRSSKIQELHIT